VEVAVALPESWIESTVNGGEASENTLGLHPSLKSVDLKDLFRIQQASSFSEMRLGQGTQFSVKHFACEVVYSADKFLERNMDKLSDDLIKCATKTSNSLIRAEFQTLLSTRNQDSLDMRRSFRKDRFVLEKSQSEMKSLLSAIEDTRTRCIKPNNNKIRRQLDHHCTMQQLERSGLVTAIQMARESFPNTLPSTFLAYFSGRRSPISSFLLFS
jgi:myosin heavy subunit